MPGFIEVEQVKVLLTKGEGGEGELAESGYLTEQDTGFFQSSLVAVVPRVDIMK